MKLSHLYLLVLLLCGYAQAQTVQPKNNKVFDTLNPAQDAPKYEVKVTSETPYRIFINDIPLLSSEKSGTITIPINSAIARSGPQHITVLRNKNDAQSKQLDVTVSVSGQTASLWKSDLKDKNTEDGTFQVSVPYQFFDWGQSTTLHQVDSARMELAKLWFNQMAEYLKSGNGKDFMQLLLPAEMNIFQANYFDKTMAISYHDGWKNYINKGGIKLADLTSGRVEIVGSGKLLHLVNDIGEGALAILYGRRKTVFDIFLHFPIGKTEPEAILFNLVEY